MVYRNSISVKLNINNWNVTFSRLLELSLVRSHRREGFDCCRKLRVEDKELICLKIKLNLFDVHGSIRLIQAIQTMEKCFIQKRLFLIERSTFFPSV